MKKFNWLDVVIVVVILVIVAGGIFMLTRQQEQAAAIESKRMEFAVELREVPLSVCKEYEGIIGLPVVIGVTNVDEGVVTDVTWKNSEMITKDVVNGEFYISDMPGTYDIVLTIEFDGTETADRISSGNEDISIGSEMVFHGKGFAGQGFVVGLRTEVPQ